MCSPCNLLNSASPEYHVCVHGNVGLAKTAGLWVVTFLLSVYAVQS